MTQSTQRDISWLWTSGATALLLAVGGLIYQVRALSSDVQELRENGSPVLKARLDVMENVVLNQQKQFELSITEIKLQLNEIRRLLQEQTKPTKP